MNLEDYFDVVNGYGDKIHAKADAGKITQQKADQLIDKLNEWLEHFPRKGWR